MVPARRLCDICMRAPDGQEFWMHSQVDVLTTQGTPDD
jgi:hypothetical protein